ncbi:uncharacterized protein A4U43_C05F21480 [Asparagus officinalis]|uniref:Uncharacterized protein n=1 Tax=Asparagus officinalis TaxID=4686 RepID=A0A5P1EVW0_ASPOF|nr:uncharacterized protein A4U43_C05F21480 [Asparagus officinalis]
MAEAAETPAVVEIPCRLRGDRREPIPSSRSSNVPPTNRDLAEPRPPPPPQAVPAPGIPDLPRRQPQRDPARRPQARRVPPVLPLLRVPRPLLNPPLHLLLRHGPGADPDGGLQELFKVSMYWKVMRALQRERSDGRTLARTVQELRMKGSSFDLSKELQLGTKRMKSSSVDGGWRPVRWMKRNAVAFCLAGFAGLVAAACKFILCS